MYHCLRSRFGSSVWAFLCLWQSAMNDREDGVGRRPRERPATRGCRTRWLGQSSSATTHKDRRVFEGGVRETYAASRGRNHLTQGTARSPAGSRAAGVGRSSREPWLSGSPSCCSAQRPHKEKDAEKIRKEEQETKQEKAREVQQPPHRRVPGDLHCSLPQRSELRGTLGGHATEGAPPTPQKLGPFFRFFLSALGVIDTVMRDVNVDTDCPWSSP